MPPPRTLWALYQCAIDQGVAMTNRANPVCIGEPHADADPAWAATLTAHPTAPMRPIMPTEKRIPLRCPDCGATTTTTNGFATPCTATPDCSLMRPVRRVVPAWLT